MFPIIKKTDSSKNKGILMIVESFVVLNILHAMGGYYFAPILAQVFHNMPKVTVEMLSSSALSPATAIIYLALRIKLVPKFSITREFLPSVIGGIVLVWMLTFVSMFFLEIQNPFAQEILKTQHSYFYFNSFLLIIWGPILEEVLFRGYFFGILRGHWNNVIALLVSSLLFVVEHGIWGGFDIGLVFIGSASAIFTLIYMQGGLFASIVVHVFVNFYLLYLNWGG